ncbi:Hypothetical protein IALB_1364 [Ignavibacterium album JCM 16511]|uniref:NHL repeat protein n=2 Tax=Ignavibacterium album TaxID=591197 RepID=I0AJB7_IGNAJ|nr:Hypothetical protein IALB_1364 [Ignavibacterium album JCM 16511]
MKNLINLILLFSSISFGQKFSYHQSIGNFENASSFYIASNGFIYITDKGNDEVIQLDTLGNILRDVGGFGWNQAQFDEPVDVFADPLSVYVTDKNNHRIQRFDRNLNFISQLFTHENDNPDERFGYPLSCVVSNQGDLYVLDSENKRIVKFDLFGNFKLQFGGIDAGEFALGNPVAMAISSNGIIFIADQNFLIAFDQFGNGFSKVKFTEQINSLEILFDNITLTSKKKILFAKFSKTNIDFYYLTTDYEFDNDIVSSILFIDKLYVLTPKKILIFLPSSD